MNKHQFKVEKIIPMPFDAAYVSMLSEQYKSGSKIPGLIKGIWFALKGKINPEKCIVLAESVVEVNSLEKTSIEKENFIQESCK